MTIAAGDLGTADAWAAAVLALGGEGPELLCAAPCGIEGFVICADDTTLQTPDLPRTEAGAALR